MNREGSSSLNQSMLFKPVPANGTADVGEGKLVKLPHRKEFKYLCILWGEHGYQSSILLGWHPSFYCSLWACIKSLSFVYFPLLIFCAIYRVHWSYGLFYHDNHWSFCEVSYLLLFFSSLQTVCKWYCYFPSLYISLSILTRFESLARSQRRHKWQLRWIILVERLPEIRNIPMLDFLVLLIEEFLFFEVSEISSL